MIDRTYKLGDLQGQINAIESGNIVIGHMYTREIEGGEITVHVYQIPMVQEIASRGVYRKGDGLWRWLKFLWWRYFP